MCVSREDKYFNCQQITVKNTKNSMSHSSREYHREILFYVAVFRKSLCCLSSISDPGPVSFARDFTALANPSLQTGSPSSLSPCRFTWNRRFTRDCERTTRHDPEQTAEARRKGNEGALKSSESVKGGEWREEQRERRERRERERERETERAAASV